MRPSGSKASPNFDAPFTIIQYWGLNLGVCVLCHLPSTCRAVCSSQKFTFGFICPQFFFDSNTVNHLIALYRISNVNAAVLF